jgi:DNA-binding NarL/FixJ family response regulator
LKEEIVLTNPKRTRVLLVDDHAVVRSGLAKILDIEPSIQIVGEAGDGEEAINQAVRCRPDVILMDIFMPRVNGLEALVIIKQKLPEVRVLFLTVSDREEDLFTALRYGAHGYLLKSASVDEVINAVKMTAQGDAVLSPPLATRLVAEFRQKHEGAEGLSGREKEVLQLLGEGLSNTEIAGMLFIGESTVRTHIQRVLSKLHLKNRAEAIAYASRHNV